MAPPPGIALRSDPVGRITRLNPDAAGTPAVPPALTEEGGFVNRTTRTVDSEDKLIYTVETTLKQNSDISRSESGDTYTMWNEGFRKGGVFYIAYGGRYSQVLTDGETAMNLQSRTGVIDIDIYPRTGLFHRTLVKPDSRIYISNLVNLSPDRQPVQEMIWLPSAGFDTYTLGGMQFVSPSNYLADRFAPRLPQLLPSLDAAAGSISRAQVSQISWHESYMNWREGSTRGGPMGSNGISEQRYVHSGDQLYYSVTTGSWAVIRTDHAAATPPQASATATLEAQSETDAATWEIRTMSND